jgi:hypothetical protein
MDNKTSKSLRICLRNFNDLEIVKNPNKKETNEAGLQKSKKETLTTAELLKLRQ